MYISLYGKDSSGHTHQASGLLRSMGLVSGATYGKEGTEVWQPLWPLNLGDILVW